MASVKEQVVSIVQDLPEDSAYEEILRELLFTQMVERGLQDSLNGRTISHDEMLRQIKSWQK